MYLKIFTKFILLLRLLTVEKVYFGFSCEKKCLLLLYYLKKSTKTYHLLLNFCIVPFL